MILKHSEIDLIPYEFHVKARCTDFIFLQDDVVVKMAN